MGVPKFYRFISDRYPSINKTVKVYEIPEYDNLYLDMNSIIHTCSHPSDSDVHFRIGKKEFSDEDIYRNVCRYVEIIFSIVKPLNLMYLAFDGVAPRAKMNQQRGNRFRVAKDIDEAVVKNEMVQDDILFDANCITTGTEFMAELMDHVKNFIAYKISNESSWQKCKMIVSGPEVPGEGEHKIMDYIRYNKAQPDYNQNTRHCLYSLDADLIVLGLCTHEPHFSLIRERVTFGKRMNMITPEESDFDLLHLSLLREYLAYEFRPIELKLKFPFDLEKIIDDWVLIGFLVGNDFIPQLPNLNIVDGALPLLYHTYIKVLPTLDGYINESGELNVSRFKRYVNKLSEFQMNLSKPCEIPEFLANESVSKRNNTEDNFKVEVFDDSNAKHSAAHDDIERRKKLIEDAFKALDFKLNKVRELSEQESDKTSSTMKDSIDTEQKNIFLESTIPDLSMEEYYKNKLKFDEINRVKILTIVEHYIKAIQWTLRYYYQGCCSWSWYYPYHYAPLTSDFDKLQNMSFDFTMGAPFLPLQHLLAVLPPANAHLLPKPLRSLLTNQNSPIIDFYPKNFEIDLNGKTNDWESIVLIPFIDENRLIKAMESYINRLSYKERKRNTEGSTAVFTYTITNLGQYPMETVFGSFENHAQLEHVKLKDMYLPKDKLITGLCRNVSFNLSFPGFPTLKHVSHSFTLAHTESKFNSHQPTKIERMILRVSPKPAKALEDLAKEFLGQKAYALWPYLTEVFIIGVTDFKKRIILTNFWKGYSQDNIKNEELSSAIITNLHNDIKLTTEKYKDLLGIEIGETNISFYIFPMIGKKYASINNGNVQLQMKWSPTSRTFPYQLLVKDEEVQRYSFILYKTINDLFIDSTTCFMISQPNYGAIGVIKGIIGKQEQLISVVLEVSVEPDLSSSIEEFFVANSTYMSGSEVAKKLKVNSTLISRITGSLKVAEDNNNKSKYHDVGLCMKFPKHEKELFGYTKKDKKYWLYSEKTLKLIQCYLNEFPVLFENLNKNLNSSTFTVSDLFPEGLAQLNLVNVWLSEQKLQYTAFVECCTQTLGLKGVEKLEKRITDFHSKEHERKTLPTQVKAQCLFVPGTLMGLVPPDFKAQHKLLDRIICVKNNFTVPLGLKGTIIGIQEKSEKCKNVYEVLFDSSFTGGLTLYESSEHMCYRLMGTDFINISFGQRDSQNSKGPKINLPFRTKVQNNNDKNSNCKNENNSKSANNAIKMPNNNAQTGNHFSDKSKKAFNRPKDTKKSNDCNRKQPNNAGNPMETQNKNNYVTREAKFNCSKDEWKTVPMKSKRSSLDNVKEKASKKPENANEKVNKKSAKNFQQDNTGTRPKVPFNKKNAAKFQGQTHRNNANPKKNMAPDKVGSEQYQSNKALRNSDDCKKSIDSKEDIKD